MMFARTASRAFARVRSTTASRSVSSFAVRAAAAPVASKAFAGFALAGVTGSAVLFGGNGVTAHCDALPVFGVPGTNQERTFLAVKPDGVQRGLIGDIIGRFEKRGYKLVGLKMVWPTLEMAEGHYADLSKKPFYGGLCKFFSSGPVVCMCWEGKDIIKQGRQMLGETQPLASKPGSIRGDFSIDLGRNICHGSDSPDAAAHELKMWFPEGVNDWGKSVDSSVYEN
uniref:Nucleoside diphosphate kinase n=1 Tax=Eucampia antarctica TaxID=49252 RepID=A0A7S2R098_9STRA|mmetsp:Transcript_10993/g.10509  ORF Transcript_10993/g.10509 Transcript_10993/m.10509 type:complete len:226 (+) Transcript_10993:70-747(+)